MIKAIWACNRHPDTPLAECHQHWFEVHGRHHAGPTHKLDGYIQHLTLAASYEGEPRPTHDGASQVWVRDFAALQAAQATAAWAAAAADAQSGLPGGRPLFRYPLVFAVGEETVIREGATTPFMVKAIFVARRNPAQDEAAFRRHWRDVHGPLCAAAPGLRRYVQNHPHGPAQAHPQRTHDGWSELWFDDLAALQAAIRSPQWVALREDGRTGAGGQPLFEAASMALVIARERPIIVPTGAAAAGPLVHSA